MDYIKLNNGNSFNRMSSFFMPIFSIKVEFQPSLCYNMYRMYSMLFARGEIYDGL